MVRKRKAAKKKAVVKSDDETTEQKETKLKLSDIYEKAVELLSIENKAQTLLINGAGNGDFPNLIMPITTRIDVFDGNMANIDKLVLNGYIPPDRNFLHYQTGDRYDRGVFFPPVNMDRIEDFTEHFTHVYELMADESVLITFMGEKVYTSARNNYSKFNNLIMHIKPVEIKWRGLIFLVKDSRKKRKKTVDTK